MTTRSGRGPWSIVWRLALAMLLLAGLLLATIDWIAVVTYIPFAVGHRNCIGGTLAMVEGKLILAQVAQRYLLDLAPGQRVEAMAATTMRPRFGMRMRVRARTPQNGR